MLNLAGRKITKTSPTFIIAEGCDNHLGKIEVAKKMIESAKECGADCIKFQHHLVDEEMLPNIPMSGNFDIPLYDFLKKYALTIEQHKELKEHCEKVGIYYLCTPFSYAAAKELMQLDVDCFKIGSGEFTDLMGMEDIIKLKKQMIFSTGMLTRSEFEDTFIRVADLMDEQHTSFAVLNCISEYPPQYADVNLNFLSYMKTICTPNLVGHSDHTPDNYTSFAAVVLGAKFIEKHFILDKSQKGPDQSVSIDPIGLKDLVDGIRKIECASGSIKILHPKEHQIRDWAFRSVVSVVDIPKGTTITRDMIYTKRPGTGIPSKCYKYLVGKVVDRDIPKNTLIEYKDLT